MPLISLDQRKRRPPSCTISQPCWDPMQLALQSLGGTGGEIQFPVSGGVGINVSQPWVTDN